MNSNILHPRMKMKDDGKNLFARTSKEAFNKTEKRGDQAND